MGVAQRAEYFIAAHSKAQIYFAYDVFLGDRRPEAGPAGAGLEFCIGAEERVGAADAAIEAGVVIVVIGAAEGPLGVGSARDIKLVRAQGLTPLGVGLDDLWHGLEA